MLLVELCNSEDRWATGHLEEELQLQVGHTLD